MNNKKKDMNKLTKNLILDISILLTILSMIVIIGAAEDVQDLGTLVGNSSSINGNEATIVLPNDIMPMPDNIRIIPADVADYKVIPIFFVPNDLTPNPFTLQAIDRQMQLIQRWYGEQLRNRTFTLEPARIVIGSHPLAYYYGDCYPVTSQCSFGYRLWDNIFSDMDGLGYPWQSNRIVGVFFQDDGTGSTALGAGGMGGRFLVSLDPFGDCLLKGCAVRVSEGGVAHELGHALGLPHPIDEWEKSVMGTGLYNFPQVSFVNTNINPEFDRLYASPFLNLPTDIKNGGFEDCLKFWSSSTKNGQCMTIGQRSGLSTFQLLPNDQTQKVTQDVASVGGKTYDFSGWLNIPIQTGSFSAQVQVIALSKSKSVLKTFAAKKYTRTTNGWERIAISMLMPSGTTYARIQITGQGKATVYVDDFDFHIAKDVPQKPLPLFYTDGDAVPTLQPELKWSEITKATSFRIQVATDKVFNRPIVDTTVLSPVYTIPSSKLTYDIRYYWRVQAINGAGKSDWSPPWSFIPRHPEKYYNEEFEIHTLSSAWSWVREDTSRWYFGGPLNLRSYGGYLGITAQSGDLLGERNNAKNLLLRNTPTGDFEETTIVNWWEPLSVNYQQGGLLIYQDDDNYIELAHAYNDGYKIQLRAEMEGNVVAQASVPIHEPRLMKIARVGTTYRGYYSPDGLTWRQLGQPITVNWSTPRMGLGAYGQINGQEIVAWFDWFRVTTPTYDISATT